MKAVAGAPDRDRLPLRMGMDRLALWSAALFVAGIFPIVLTWHVATGDLSILEEAGRVVGTPQLLHPEPAYNAFVYMPGAAWFCVPLAHLAHPAAFFCNAVLMLGCAIAAGLAAARVYGLTREAAIALVLAWAPVTNAVALGQNAPLGLLLAMLTILGLAQRASLLTGISLGMLLYKPTYALPLLAVAVLFGRWRAVGIVVLLGAAWYVLSVAATGGDVKWPAGWIAMASAYNGADFAHNADKAISLAGILRRVAMPPAAIALLMTAIAAVSVVPLRRASVSVAAGAACAVGLTISPHAWGYDGVMLLPLLFVAMRTLREPLRTPLIAIVYVSALLVDYVSALRFDVVAIWVIGGTMAWIVAGYRDRKALVT